MSGRTAHAQSISDGRVLLLIVFLVVLIRCAVFMVYPERGPHLERFDPDGWLGIAQNLISGQGFSFPSSPEVPTARRGPTVVYFLAAVLWLAGDSVWSVVVAQWLVDAGTATLLFFIAREVFQDRRVAIVAALLFALYGSGLVYTFAAWSEPFFTFVLAAFTLSLLVALREPSLWRFTLCGVLLGVTVLGRPFMQFYPVVMLPLLWWRLGKPWREVLARFIIAGAAFAIILLPWVIRNYIAFQSFVPASTHSGNPFFQSHFVLHEPDYLRYRTVQESDPALRQVLEARFGPAPGIEDPYAYARAKGITEHQVDRIAFEEAIKAIRAHPDRYIVASVVRLGRFWFGSRFVNLLQGRGSLLSFPVPFANGILLALALIPLVCYRGTWVGRAVPLFALVIYTMVIYAATLALARYSVPIMPYVMVFAAYAIVQLVTKSTQTSFSGRSHDAAYSR
jgi:4-amino-4-deoxy-L-arabinose transferase-like glycosyltransferase